MIMVYNGLKSDLNCFAKFSYIYETEIKTLVKESEFSNKYKDAFQHSWKKLKKQVKYAKINELENFVIDNGNNNYSLYYTKSKVLILDFCRHFRNSFSHALTTRKQGILFINDKKGIKNTCLGFVNYSDAKQFIIEIINEYELRAND